MKERLKGKNKRKIKRKEWKKDLKGKYKIIFSAIVGQPWFVWSFINDKKKKYSYPYFLVELLTGKGG